MTAAAPPGVQGAPLADAMAITTRGLMKRYGSRPALNGLDLNVPQGTVYGFLGPNGSGKTTTLRLLVGLIRPDAGSIQVLGQPYSWRDRRRMFRIGSLIETPAFYPYLSGRDNLRVFGAAGAPTRRERIDEVLSGVGLSDRARDKVKTYSLGMKQRLGIAAALLSDPELLLLDEPANGLDPGGIVAMREMLRYLTSQGKTVVVSSHILPEVQQLADVVGILAAGRLIREGPLGELLEDTGHVRVRVALAEMADAARSLKALAPDKPLYGIDSGAGAGWFTVGVLPSRASEVNRVLSEAGIHAMGLEAGNDLEALFLELTQGAPTGQPVPPMLGTPVA